LAEKRGLKRVDWMEWCWACGTVGGWVDWLVEKMAVMMVEWTDTVLDGYLAEHLALIGVEY
jgi:hypothetical protein